MQKGMGPQGFEQAMNQARGSSNQSRGSNNISQGSISMNYSNQGYGSDNQFKKYQQPEPDTN